MGYVQDTHMSQYIPPTLFHCVTGTWTNAAGAVTGTIAKHVAAADQTAVVNIPILLPSNSNALKGAYLKSIEVDFEILIAACDAVDAVINKVTRGADEAVAVVSSVTVTQSLVAATTAATEDQHKLTVTLTTPEWIDNDVYYLLTLTLVCGGTVTVDILAAVANYTLRL